MTKAETFARRPPQYWALFNEWSRDKQAAQGKKPRVSEIREWWEVYSDTIWPEDAPSFAETKKHAKGVRTKEAIKTYFRGYRMRCKLTGAKRPSKRHKKRPTQEMTKSAASDSSSPDEHVDAASEEESQGAADGAAGPLALARPRRNRAKPRRSSDIYLSDGWTSDEAQDDDELDESEDEADAAKGSEQGGYATATSPSGQDTQAQAAAADADTLGRDASQQTAGHNGGSGGGCRPVDAPMVAPTQPPASHPVVFAAAPPYAPQPPPLMRHKALAAATTGHDALAYAAGPVAAPGLYGMQPLRMQQAATQERQSAALVPLGSTYGAAKAMQTEADEDAPSHPYGGLAKRGRVNQHPNPLTEPEKRMRPALDAVDAANDKAAHPLQPPQRSALAPSTHRPLQDIHNRMSPSAGPRPSGPMAASSLSGASLPGAGLSGGNTEGKGVGQGKSRFAPTGAAAAAANDAGAPLPWAMVPFAKAPPASMRAPFDLALGHDVHRSVDARDGNSTARTPVAQGQRPRRSLQGGYAEAMSPSRALANSEAAVPPGSIRRLLDAVGGRADSCWALALPGPTGRTPLSVLRPQPSYQKELEELEDGVFGSYLAQPFGFDELVNGALGDLSTDAFCAPHDAYGGGSGLRGGYCSPQQRAVQTAAAPLDAVAHPEAAMLFHIKQEPEEPAVWVPVAMPAFAPHEPGRMTASQLPAACMRSAAAGSLDTPPQPHVQPVRHMAVQQHQQQLQAPPPAMAAPEEPAPPLPPMYQYNGTRGGFPAQRPLSSVLLPPASAVLHGGAPMHGSNNAIGMPSSAVVPANAAMPGSTTYAAAAAVPANAVTPAYAPPWMAAHAAGYDDRPASMVPMLPYYAGFPGFMPAHGVRINYP